MPNSASTSDKFDNVANIYNGPIFQLYYFLAHSACINYLKPYLKDNQSILDIACGTGIFLKKILKQKEGLKLAGIDNSKKMISVARLFGDKIDFREADAENSSFEKDSFDIVTIIDAIYYFPNKEAALSECKRVLRPGGYLFLFYPAIDIIPNFILDQIKLVSRSLFFNLEENSSIVNIKELEKLAGLSGLKLINKKMQTMHRFIIFKKI